MSASFRFRKETCRSDSGSKSQPISVGRSDGQLSSFWLKLLPVFLQIRIKHRPNLQKIIANTGWLFGDRILRLGVGLFVGVWVARYLGPEKFGLLNYAMAFAALFAAIGSVGLNSIVVRDLVQKPDIASATLGSAFLLQVVGGLLAFAVAVISVGYARPHDLIAKSLVAVLSFVMVFKSTDVVRYWFDSQVQSKYPVAVENTVFLLFALVKVGLILAQASLMAFAWAALTEGVLVSLALLVMYVSRSGRLGVWQARYVRAKSLLKESWPLILSGITVMVYMRIDQIMLGQMLGDKAVGIYSAAVRISEVWYFIPMAIATSAFPSVLEAKKQSAVLYQHQIQKLYRFVVVLAFGVAIFSTFSASWLVAVLFGDQYSQSAEVLAIHIWGGISVAISTIHGKWLVAEGLQKYALLYTATGCLVNIVLNILFIKEWGSVGAAYATLAAQIAPYFLLLVSLKTRQHLVVILKSFILKPHGLLA